jgi:hypothetical protein
MLEKGNLVLQHEFPTWKRLILPSLSSIPLKKGTLWKVTKDTIDTTNEEFFSCAKLRSKSLNLPLCIKKINIMHLPKRIKVKAKRI